VDPLRRDDLERARETRPEVKLRQALEAMSTGIRLAARAETMELPEVGEYPWRGPKSSSR
jgi:hypothetical protein